MNITQPVNAKILNYLTHEGDYMYRKKPDAPVFAYWNSVPDPYTLCGCHPEVVGRLWDEINAGLPEDCRGLVYSNPALVHPKRGVIFAVGLGTWYGLRLPGLLALQATTSGAVTVTKFSTGDMDIQHRLGEDWVFGAWLKDEVTWCKEAIRAFTDLTSPDHSGN